LTIQEINDFANKLPDLQFRIEIATIITAAVSFVNILTSGILAIVGYRITTSRNKSLDRQKSICDYYLPMLNYIKHLVLLWKQADLYWKNIYGKTSIYSPLIYLKTNVTDRIMIQANAEIIKWMNEYLSKKPQIGNMIFKEFDELVLKFDMYIVEICHLNPGETSNYYSVLCPFDFSLASLEKMINVLTKRLYGLEQDTAKKTKRRDVGHGHMQSTNS